jgi:hypothetical protein
MTSRRANQTPSHCVGERQDVARATDSTLFSTPSQDSAPGAQPRWPRSGAKQARGTLCVWESSHAGIRARTNVVVGCMPPPRLPSTDGCTEYTSSRPGRDEPGHVFACSSCSRRVRRRRVVRAPGRGGRQAEPNRFLSAVRALWAVGLHRIEILGDHHRQKPRKVAVFLATLIFPSRVQPHGASAKRQAKLGKSSMSCKCNCHG